jgi:hypothetical protein
MAGFRKIGSISDLEKIKKRSTGQQKESSGKR